MLQTLLLAGNPIGDEGANEFLAAAVPPRLFLLFLLDCGISEPIQVALRERFGSRVHTGPLGSTAGGE
jgi:hypothetical protein